MLKNLLSHWLGRLVVVIVLFALSGGALGLVEALTPLEIPTVIIGLIAGWFGVDIERRLARRYGGKRAPHEV